MATVLFIKRSDIVKNSIIDGGVDTDKFIYFIKLAQTMHVQNYLGTKLYDKITNDIFTATTTPNVFSGYIDENNNIEVTKTEYIEIKNCEIKLSPNGQYIYCYVDSKYFNIFNAFSKSSLVFTLFLSSNIISNASKSTMSWDIACIIYAKSLISSSLDSPYGEISLLV